MRHRRYPVKKNVKIKASDPLTKGKGGGSKLDNKKKNRTPTLDEVDQQMVPRRLLDIKQAVEEDKNKPTKRKRGTKNKFIAMTSKLGFHQRPWEDQEMFSKRVMRAKNKALDDEMIKVKAGMAGRDVEELEEEFKQLDDIDERKKKTKSAKKEKMSRLKEKKLKKKLDAEAEQKEHLLLNAREVIPFGERVDAPPEFGANLRKIMDPLNAKAGNKDLLLKKLIAPTNSTQTIEDESEPTLSKGKSRQKVDERERLKVIQAYRDMKKNKTRS